jgi:hypothetical protein
MNETLFRLAVFALAAVTVIAVFRMVTSTVLRLADKQRENRALPRAEEIEARLERMETAIDAVAIELERIGEHQRFSAQLAAGASPVGDVSGRAKPQGTS